MNTKSNSDLLDFIKTILLAAILAFFLRFFIFSVSYVDGESMTPTLESGDRLILQKYKTSLGIETFKREDIIVFKSPIKEKDHYIKRIIGIEGDKINIKNGRVFVNDIPIKEPYIESGLETDPIYFGNGYVVPKEKVFVIGDNRHPGESNDSRSFGAISTNAISGKTKYMIYPHFKKVK